MKRPLLMVMAMGVSACDSEPQAEEPPRTEAVIAAPDPAGDRQSKPAQLIPKPKDQAELDRLTLAGYTPHADHLHAPGVKSCPLAQGNEAVM